MVGLGFNVSLGAITRESKGIPDDFKFDIVTKRINMKENITTSVGVGVSIEFLGFDKVYIPAYKYHRM